MIEQQLKPGFLAKSILHRSVKKVTPDRALQAMQGYFRLFREHYTNRVQINIAEELTLVTSIAEAYTKDECYTLFNAGIVLFPEIMFLDFRKLQKIICLRKRRLIKALQDSTFTEVSELPAKFKERLFELGFIDSVRWKGYSFQESLEFYYLVVPRHALFNPLPEDLGDILSNLTKKKSAISVKSMEPAKSDFESPVLSPKEIPEKNIVDNILEDIENNPDQNILNHGNNHQEEEDEEDFDDDTMFGKFVDDQVF